MWLERSTRYGDPEFNLSYGPHRYPDQQTFGYKLYHTIDELLQMESTFNQTTFKRLPKIKEGNTIKAHYLHSCGELYVKRITENAAKYAGCIS